MAVVMPAHDEAQHIGGVLASIPEFVDRIIVVDDGSDDATSSVVESGSDPRLRLLRQDANGGLGAAMRVGYRAALREGFDLVAKLDADGQMRSEELARLAEPVASGMADYVTGNRLYLRGGSCEHAASAFIRQFRSLVHEQAG